MSALRCTSKELLAYCKSYFSCGSDIRVPRVGTIFKMLEFAAPRKTLAVGVPQ